MARTVWKYSAAFTSSDVAEVEMVRDAQVLHADGSPDGVEVWALVDSDEDRTERRRLRIAGTGHSLDATGAGVHVSTWRDGPFVWHLFDLGSVEEAERAEEAEQRGKAEDMANPPGPVVDTRAPDDRPPAEAAAGPADGTPPA